MARPNNIQLPYISQILTLGQLFANPNFVHTPPYQRSFVWTRDEASTLLDEITTRFDAQAGEGAARTCFLGTILFIEAEKSSSLLGNWSRSRNQRTLEVVDGLQRLTTLTILLALLRDLDQSKGKRVNDRLLTAIAETPNGRPRLTLRGADDAFLHAHARDPGGTAINPDNEKLSPSQAKLIEVREYLRETLEAYDLDQRRHLAEFVLGNCCADVITTTDIDRAHGIFTVLNTAGKPLGWNDVLKAHLLRGIPGVAEQRAVDVWDMAESRLGPDFESLFGHIRTLHGRNSPTVIAAVKDIAARSGGGQAFIENILQPSAAVLEKIVRCQHSGSPHSVGIAGSLTYLGWLKGNTDWVPPALLWWLENGPDAAELDWFLRALERLAFLLRIQGRGNKRRQTRMGAVLEAIRNGQGLKRPSSPLHPDRTELSSVHYSLRDLHKRHATMAKLVLLRLNDALAGKPQNLPAEEFTVEHILPRKPGANSPWRTLFPDAAHRERCTESLGNLVLVSKQQNDRAGNQPFARKNEVLFGVGPHFPINEYVRRQTEWKAAQIEEREAELLRLLDRIWQIGPAPQRRDGSLSTGTPPSTRRKVAAGA